MFETLIPDDELIRCWQCGEAIPEGDLDELLRLAGWINDNPAPLPMPAVRTESGAVWTGGDAHYCAGCGPHVAVCRGCGCTEENACEGGCWWVESDLCSACEGGKECP